MDLGSAFIQKVKIDRDFIALKSLLIGLLVLSGILIPFFIVKAETIFEDDFESYNLDQLNTQGGWIKIIGTYPNVWWVVDDIKYQGQKSAYANGLFTMIDYKIGNTIETGRITYFFRYKAKDPPDPVDYFEITFQKFGYTAPIVITIQEGKLYYSTDALWKTFYADIEEEVWHFLEIEWNHITESYRINLNKGGWLDWINRIDLHFDLNQIIMNSRTQEVWIDTIQEILPPMCELESCDICEIYETCIEAGCFWYITIYPDPFFKYGYCVEPFEPEEEDCGSFFKCQYCMTAETCGEQLNCEWVDRYNLGEKCYMKEPVIPPTQEAWEVPELEDCEALSGVEKWLCEIKNFVAGIFMPSQEKVNSLFQTFGSFSQKFPFSYILATKDFFSYVKTNVEVEKEIPIKILGHQSNVSFSFFEATGKVGGVSETIGDTIKDFTSLVLILGFLTWLLYFIRNFF